MKHSENSIPYRTPEFLEAEDQLYRGWFNSRTEGAAEAARKIAEDFGKPGSPYARVLGLLSDCPEPAEITPAHRCGATYKQLALIAHRVGMSDAQRRDWYEFAKMIPLAGAHAGHIIARLDDLGEIEELEELFARS